MDPDLVYGGTRAGKCSVPLFFCRAPDAMLATLPGSSTDHQNMIARQQPRVAKGTALMLYLSTLCLISSRATAWVINVPALQQQQKQRPFQTQLSSPIPRTAIQMTTATSPASTTTAATATAGTVNDPRPLSTVIVGGGPAGLAVALMLARRGYQDITVLERLSEPPPPSSDQWGNPERSYNLGIGGRGQVSLAEIGAADRVISWCAEAVVSWVKIARNETTQGNYKSKYTAMRLLYVTR